MPRYIDADELLRKSILRITGHWDLPHGGAQNFSAIPDTVIMNFPTADVAPIVHGYWKPIYPDKISEHQNRAKYYECSVCGRTSADENYSNGLDYEFCPYCSAKMDKNTEETQNVGQRS